MPGPRGRPPKLHLSRSRRIWADADDCSAAVREQLFQTANRHRVVLTLVSLQERQWPASAFIRSLVVAAGFEGVAQRLRQLAAEGDVVVSSDRALGRELTAAKVIVVAPAQVRSVDELLAQLEQQARASAAARKQDPDERDAA